MIDYIFAGDWVNLLPWWEWDKPYDYNPEHGAGVLLHGHQQGWFGYQGGVCALLFE